MNKWDSIGVDWSSGAWVAVGYSGHDEPKVAVYDHIEELWKEHREITKRVVVDVPIGLCETRESEDCRCERQDGELSRRCDDLARKFIGPRSSSVFTSPCRRATKMAASEVPYSEINAKNKELTGKGLMRQAANISRGIVEVENLLLDRDGDSDVLVEGHPEVCFRAFSGKPLQYSKKYAAGVDERLAALERVEEYTEGDWRKLAGRLREETRKVDLDDLLDAIVLSLTACASEEEMQTLPDDPPRDRKGLPMQMVYRAVQPWGANVES